MLVIRPAGESRRPRVLNRARSCGAWKLGVLAGRSLAAPVSAGPTGSECAGYSRCAGQEFSSGRHSMGELGVPAHGSSPDKSESLWGRTRSTRRGLALPANVHIVPAGLPAREPASRRASIEAFAAPPCSRRNLRLPEECSSHPRPRSSHTSVRLRTTCSAGSAQSESRDAGMGCHTPSQTAAGSSM